MKSIFQIILILLVTGMFSCSNDEKEIEPKSLSIFRIEPTLGPPGINVVISGKTFENTLLGNQVIFGDIEGVIVSANDSTLTAKVPENATTGEIKVTARGQTAEGPVFTVTPAPNIVSVYPTEGSIGTFVTIKGQHFSPDLDLTIVKFNGIKAFKRSVSSNEIIVVVPAEATTGNITVSTTGLELDAGSFTVTELKLTYDVEVTVSTVAEIENFTSIYFSKEEKVYLSTNSQILELNPDFSTTVIAGIKGDRSYIDGPTSIATFDVPIQMTEDLNGDLLISDINNKAIRKISNNEVSTYYSNSNFFLLLGIVMDNMDNIYIAELTTKIWKLTPQMNLTIFANYPAVTGNTVRFAIDSDENIFVISGNQILKVSQSGIIEPFAGSDDPGIIDGSGSEARFNYPLGITIGADGYLYIADSDNYLIRRISPEKDVTTVCGLGIQGIIDGDSNTAMFLRPTSILSARAGDLLVVDNEQFLRKIHLK